MLFKGSMFPWEKQLTNTKVVERKIFSLGPLSKNVLGSFSLQWIWAENAEMFAEAISETKWKTFLIYVQEEDLGKP